MTSRSTSLCTSSSSSHELSPVLVASSRSRRVTCSTWRPSSRPLCAAVWSPSLSGSCGPHHHNRPSHAVTASAYKTRMSIIAASTGAVVSKTERNFGHFLSSEPHADDSGRLARSDFLFMFCTVLRSRWNR